MELKKVNNVDLQVERGRDEAPPTYQAEMSETERIAEIGNMKMNNNTSKVNAVDCEVLSATQRLIATLNSIITFLRRTSQCCTVLFDVILWITSIAILTTGCLLITQKIEISTVVYQVQFRALGITMVTVGCLNVAIFVPFGVLGTWKKKRALLKWHNIWLILNVVFQLVVLYMCFKYARKRESEHKSIFSKEFNANYIACHLKVDKIYSRNLLQLKDNECCCFRSGTTINEKCWRYEPEVAVTDENDPRYQLHCMSKLDYFNRTHGTIIGGAFYLCIFLIIQAIALTFGYLTFFTLPHPDDELDDIEASQESLVKAQQQPPKEKKQMSLFKKVLIFFVIKRIFLILLFGLFALSIWGIERATKNEIVYLPTPNGDVPVDLWKLLVALFPFQK